MEGTIHAADRGKVITTERRDIVTITIEHYVEARDSQISLLGSNRIDF